LLNGKTLKSNESRVAGKKLKDKRLPDLKSQGYTRKQSSGELGKKAFKLATSHQPPATSHQPPATSSPAPHDFAAK
jgi:hypothetical protein